MKAREFQSLEYNALNCNGKTGKAYKNTLLIKKFELKKYDWIW